MLQEKLSDPAHQSMFAAAFDPKIFATAPGIEAFRDDLMILAQKMVEIGFRELPYTWIAVDETGNCFVRFLDLAQQPDLCEAHWHEAIMADADQWDSLCAARKAVRMGSILESRPINEIFVSAVDYVADTEVNVHAPIKRSIGEWAEVPQDEDVKAESAEGV